MLRIGLDIDEVSADFMGGYKKKFQVDLYPNRMESSYITKMCMQKLRFDKDFWVNLDLIHSPDFQPTLYCTKRVNPKSWTKEFLNKHNLPLAPIYQMYYQYGNKADMIGKKVDVFIDDSVRNVEQISASGIPCILMDTDFNRYAKHLVRIDNLNYSNIEELYLKHF